ncbi:MAG: hypothetical protein MAG431_01660 [Chloroflexi bacterium]|nr:hypothetical protein [Chloroflexota bacterium]
MDFGQAFAFVFEDEEWLKKVGIAGLIFLIPIVGIFVVLGWSLEITRRVIGNHPEPLPDWADFMDYLVKGLQVFVIGFVYMLPVVVLQTCSSGSLALLGSEDEAVITALSIISICFGCITFLYGLAVGLIFPAAIGNFAAKDELKAAFNFGEVFGIARENIGVYALVLLGSIVTGFIASLGAVACGIGIAFTSAYAYAVNGHLWGQAYNAALPGGGAAAAVESIPEPDPDFSDDF